MPIDVSMEPRIRAALFHQHLFIRRPPRIRRQDFDIEQDEQRHGHEIKFDGETRVAFADRQHAAFVSGVFDTTAAAEFARAQPKATSVPALRRQ